MRLENGPGVARRIGISGIRFAEQSCVRLMPEQAFPARSLVRRGRHPRAEGAFGRTAAELRSLETTTTVTLSRRREAGPGRRGNCVEGARRSWRSFQAIIALGMLVLAGCSDTCEATNETHDCVQVSQPYD